jgi:DNA-binding transcriptional MocR family regulator
MIATTPAPSTDLHATLYQQVADRVAGLIGQGTLRPGARVPSVRKLSRTQRVSIATVTQAYRLLERQHLIEARPQSGYYVSAKRWTPPAEPGITQPPGAPTAVQGAALTMQLIRAIRNPALIRLGATLPSPELFPTLELNRVSASAGRRSPKLGNSYDPPPGLPALRQQLAQRAIDLGCTLGPDAFVITCGATEAVHLALRAVTKRGDCVAIESPVFFGILQIIDSLGLRACEVPTYPREGICLDELAARLRRCCIKACVFTPNFSNPLGSCMPDAKKEKLVRLLADRNVPLIEDDIYGDLPFSTPRPKVCKAYDRDGRVLLCSSFTKTLAPGYRIGWIAPGAFHERIEYLKFVSTGATATLPQMCIAEYLASGSYDRHLRKVRRVYADQVIQMTRAITEYFPADTKVTRPSGGLALWVELPKRLSALELYQRALGAGVSIAPGPMFSPTQRFKNFIRLNSGNLWSSAIDHAVRRVGDLARAMLAGNA